MVLRQWKRPLTFLPRPLGDMFCKSEGLIQSGTHILSYCADSFAVKVCPPIGLYRLPRLPGLESDTGNALRSKVGTSRLHRSWLSSERRIIAGQGSGALTMKESRRAWVRTPVRVCPVTETGNEPLQPTL